MLLQKAFHTPKPVNSISTTVSPILYLVSLANELLPTHDQSKAYLAEWSWVKEQRAIQTARALFCLGSLTTQEILIGRCALSRRGSRDIFSNYVLFSILFFFQHTHTRSVQVEVLPSYSLAFLKPTGNQLFHYAWLIKNSEYQCSFLAT